MSIVSFLLEKKNTYRQLYYYLNYNNNKKIIHQSSSSFLYKNYVTPTINPAGKKRVVSVECKK